MRINRKTTGTIATWSVNLSNQWKSRNRNDFGAFVLPSKGIQHFTPHRTISQEHNYSIQAGAGWFPDGRLLPPFLFDKLRLFMLPWDSFYDTTNPPTLNGHLHNAGKKNITPYKAAFVSVLPTQVENSTLKEGETGKKGMQWYCKAQLFTSHQAERSQRHNMSQHAKQCKLEHPRFPETRQHKD